MAAILPYLETEQYQFKTESLAGLGSAVLTDAQQIANSNVEQTRLLYTRTLLQQALAGTTFSLVQKGREIKIRLSKAFDRNTIPWARAASATRNVSLFSTNSKMRCPTFDLPAGSSTVGGTCPAAEPAQTISLQGRPPSDFNMLADNSRGRLALKLYPDVEFNLAKTVCSKCYATGGKYGEPSVQISELVRYAVVSTATRDAAIREAFIQTVLWQIPLLPYDKWLVGNIKKRDASGVDEDDDTEDATAEKTLTKEDIEKPDDVLARMDKYPNVLRIHSSGDFFDLEYAKMWVEIARRLYKQHGKKYILWAPTRTHVLPGFKKLWASADVPPNFVIRPSAYHLGDPAPAAAGLSAGTSVLTPEDSRESKGIKYDHQCGVYDLVAGNKTCVSAKPPGWKDGDPIGCRACWVRPDLRVNYVAH